MKSLAALRGLVRKLAAPAIAGFLAFGSVSGCAPLTFSNAGAVDFQRYRSVRVDRVVGPDSAYATDYLVEELRAISGFESVSSAPGNSADVVLEVALRIVVREQIDLDGDVSIAYVSSVTFRARTRSGEIVEQGELEDESSSYDEALEDALDRVAHHFLKPYRA